MDVVNELKQHFPSLQFEIKKNETFYPKRGSLDISKALKLTKYLPKTSLTEGIKKYINFVKSNL
jgi:nucleoside-diphosphate-sugar epimerase